MPLVHAFERDSLVCPTSRDQPAGRDEPDDLPLAGDRRPAAPTRSDHRSLWLVREELELDRPYGGLPRAGAGPARGGVHGSGPRDADEVAVAARPDRLLRVELQGLEGPVLPG